jgi:hypothetical protein
MPMDATTARDLANAPRTPEGVVIAFAAPIGQDELGTKGDVFFKDLKTLVTPNRAIKS